MVERTRLSFCTLLAPALVLTLAATVPAPAQQSESGPQTTEPMTEPDVPDFGEEPRMTEPMTEPEIAPDPATEADPLGEDEGGSETVEVSLGDWKIKNAIADDLGLSVADVPLTIMVPVAVASTVCPISTSDLEQQEVVSPTQTCAAKRLSPELRDEARGQLSPEAKEELEKAGDEAASQ